MVAWQNAGAAGHRFSRLTVPEPADYFGSAGHTAPVAGLVALPNRSHTAAQPAVGCAPAASQPVGMGADAPSGEQLRARSSLTGSGSPVSHRLLSRQQRYIVAPSSDAAEALPLSSGRVLQPRPPAAVPMPRRDHFDNIFCLSGDGIGRGRPGSSSAAGPRAASDAAERIASAPPALLAAGVRRRRSSEVNDQGARVSSSPAAPGAQRGWLSRPGVLPPLLPPHRSHVNRLHQQGFCVHLNSITDGNDVESGRAGRSTSRSRQ